MDAEIVRLKLSILKKPFSAKKIAPLLLRFDLRDNARQIDCRFNSGVPR